MDYQKTLPATGAGIVVGGTVISEQWLLAAALALVVAGAIVIRLAFRRGKKATDK